MGCGNFSPTRSWETWPACGCSSPNCCGWGPGTWYATGRDKGPNACGPRLALQLIHEAALCITGLRHRRGLNQHIFELANGLPFLATDMAIHELLAARTVAREPTLASGLGQAPPRLGPFSGTGSGHRSPSRPQLQQAPHAPPSPDEPHARPTPLKPSSCWTPTPTSQSVSPRAPRRARPRAAAEELLGLAADILDTQPGQTLVVADAEHFTVELLDKVKAQTNFDLLVPMPDQPSRRKKLQELPPEAVPTALGRLRDREAGLHAQEQPDGAVLPIRSTARESGPRSTTSRHSSRQRTATKSRS